MAVSVLHLIVIQKQLHVSKLKIMLLFVSKAYGNFAELLAPLMFSSQNLIFQLGLPGRGLYLYNMYFPLSMT